MKEIKSSAVDKRRLLKFSFSVLSIELMNLVPDFRMTPLVTKEEIIKKIFSTIVLQVKKEDKSQNLALLLKRLQEIEEFHATDLINKEQHFIDKLRAYQNTSAEYAKVYPGHTFFDRILEKTLSGDLSEIDSMIARDPIFDENGVATIVNDIPSMIKYVAGKTGLSESEVRVKMQNGEFPHRIDEVLSIQWETVETSEQRAKREQAEILLRAKKSAEQFDRLIDSVHMAPIPTNAVINQNPHVARPLTRDERLRQIHAERATINRNTPFFVDSETVTPVPEEESTEDDERYDDDETENQTIYNNPHGITGNETYEELVARFGNLR